ncbi:hypothetical protein GIB67_039179 [Kingdonia uniflora]|uniref:Uncharacterized protein n=1 Tax=Kingdonia uniflora TaxID=39325 RepID=A0A7J7MMB3_9MAGN|nr:hypothetical protein GIB67_039179 [Kingdonia uniflora]
MGNEGPMFTVDEALASVGFGNFQDLVLVYVGMGWASKTMEMILFSFIGPAVQSDWGISSRQESFITSIVFSSMLIGAYLWGVVLDNHGRRVLRRNRETMKPNRTGPKPIAFSGF